MFFKIKKILTPISNEVKETDAIEFWQVRWHSRYGKWSNEFSEENEVFLNEKDANDFAQSLKNAFKLIRHTYGTEVQVFKK